MRDPKFIARYAGIVVERDGQPKEMKAEDLVASIQPRIKVEPAELSSNSYNAVSSSPATRVASHMRSACASSSRAAYMRTPRTPASSPERGRLLEPTHREGGHERVRELALEAIDLTAQRAPGGSLVGLDRATARRPARWGQNLRSDVRLPSSHRGPD